MKSAGEQIAEYKAKIKELEDKQLEELQAKKAELEKQLEAIDAEINAIFPPFQGGPAAKTKRSPKAFKAAGIQVSVKALEERIKAAGGTVNVRKEGLDLASVRKAVDESKGKFKIERTAPAWPLVVMA